MKKRTKKRLTALVMFFVLCMTVTLTSCGNKNVAVDSGATALTSEDNAATSDAAEEPEGTTTEEEETTDAEAEYQTEVVTDANGEPVTDESGNVVTEIVTDENGNAVLLVEGITEESETTEEPEGTTAEAEETEEPTTTTPAATTTPGTTTAQNTTKKKEAATTKAQTTQQTTTTKKTETTTAQKTYTFSEANETLLAINSYGADFWNTAGDAADLKTSTTVKHIDQYTEVTLTGICKEVSYVYRIKYNGTTYYTYGNDFMTSEEYEAKLEEYEAEQESIRIANLPTLCKEMLTLVNELRAENGVDPLIWCEEMEEGTLIRAEELAVNYSHTRPDGTNCSTAFSYLTAGVLYFGENAYGSDTGVVKFTAQEAFDAWCNSEGHLANMLMEEYTHFCCAYSYKGAFWVQEFGIVDD